MPEHGDNLNRRLSSQSAKPPVDLAGPKRRTWEGYADDYRSLSERLVEMSARHEALLDAQDALERELAEKDRAIDRLKARRVKDLDRLAEMARTRDSLERRASVQIAKVATALAKVREKERQIAALEQRTEIVAPRIAFAPPPNNTPQPTNDELASQVQQSIPPQPCSSAIVAHGTWSRLMLHHWWRRTIQYGHQAHQSGELIQAATLFRMALLAKESSPLWAKLGNVLRELKQFPAAEQAYEQVLKAEPGNGEVWFLAGYCAEMTGRNDIAVRRYEQAVALQPGLTDKYDHMRDFHARLMG